MKNKLKIILPIVLCVLAAVAVYLLIPNTVEGVVTELDTSKPLVNVSVSDGRNVVKTDENGRFEISLWRKAHFVTVTTPSGYATDDYYIRISKDVDSYDFKLEKSEATAQTEHSFIQISDTEIGEKGTGEWLQDLKTTVKETNPAFLIHTGDICYEAGLKKHIEEMNTDTMGCTVRYVIGNHDYVKGKYGEELYESLYGPVWYSFDVGKVHYVITSFQTGSDYKSRYNKNDRWRWLEEDLNNIDEDMRVVMFNHTESSDDSYVLSFDGKQLDLKEHNLIAWIFGHYHYNYVSLNNGVVNISAPRPDCGGIDSSVSGARVISINSDFSVSTEMKYYDVSREASPQNTLWQTQLNGNILYCDTVSDGDFIYTATVDDDYPNQNSAVYCLDSTSGEVVWKYTTINSVKNNVLIYDEFLVAEDADGNVYCLNKKSGELLWQKQIDLGNSLGVAGGICQQNGVAFCGTSRVITALDIKSGELVWSTTRDKGENSPAEFTVCGDKLIVSSHWDSLAALDISSGKELWSNSDEDIRFRSSTPLVIGNDILVADSDAIMIVDSTTGEIKSKTELEDYNFSSSAAPVYKDGIAYIPTANKGLVAFDIETAKIVWSFETDENIVYTAPYVGKGSKTIESTPVIDGSCVIFGANDGYIYALELTNGSLVSKHQAGSSILGKTYATDDKIYAACFNGSVVCFQK